MAIPFLDKLTSRGQTVPRGNDVGLPIDQTIGHTAPKQDPGQVHPRVGAPPRGASGRANFYGLPQWDEVNAKLVGPRGMLVFDEMYRTDAHVRRLILAAWAPIVAGTWSLEPYGGEDAKQSDIDIADAIWWMLTEWMNPNLEEHLYSLGPLLLRSGFAPYEQLWAPCDYKGKQLIGPRKLDVRLPKTIWKWWQDDFGDLTWIGQILPNKADVVTPAEDLVYYRLGAEGDNWMGTSLLRHAYKNWYLKDKLERIDAIGQERKAVGVPIVYVSPEVPPKTRDDLQIALANMHMSEVAYLMVPGWKMGEAPQNSDPGEQFLVDIVKFDSSSGEGIQKSLSYHETAIAASFLTDFLELGHHQVGARATAEVQEDPFLTAIAGVLLPPVLPPLNGLVDRIRKLNWKNAEGSPKLKVTLHDDASLTEIAAYATQLEAAGMLVADPDLEDYFRERASFPVANAKFRAAQQQQQDAERQAEIAKSKATAADPQGLKAAAANAKNKPPPGKQLELDQGAPVAAGLVARAGDTGRVLMIQRQDSKADDDDTRARWEFPGGKLDDGEDAYDGGLREWSEETGAKLPRGSRRLGQFTTPDGKYRAIGVHIPREQDLKLNPQTREVAAVGWWDPDSLHRDARVRGKVQQMLPQVHQLLGTRRTLDQANADDSNLVCFDFDGVIHPRDADSNGPPLDGAVELLDATAQDGFDVCILTARSDLDSVRSYLRQHGLGQFAAHVTNVKPPALAYVDDRAVHPHGGVQTTLGKIRARAKQAKQLDAPTPPPNLRAATDPDERCATCKMFWQGECGGYWNQPVEPGWVCDSWVQSESPVALDAAAAAEPLSGGTVGGDGLQMVDEVGGDQKPKRRRRKKGDDDTEPPKSDDTKPPVELDTPEPTATWWEKLLSQDRLKDALDGARQHVEQAAGPATLEAARQLAYQASEGRTPEGEPPAELVDALTRHYEDMYRLGQQTVADELARQRAALGKQLDAGDTTAGAAAGGSRLGKARERGEHSAQNIMNKVKEIVGRSAITGLKTEPATTKAAEQAAVGQLHLEALNNVAAQINDGRAAAATAAPDVVGAYYTAVLDPNTCGECEKADDGTLLSPDAALALGPPNPDCDGGDRCRCMLVWVLSNDPAAVQMLESFAQPEGRLLRALEQSHQQHRELIDALAGEKQPPTIEVHPHVELSVPETKVEVKPEITVKVPKPPRRRRTRTRVIRDEKTGEVVGSESEEE